ncbi:hypothetical protein HaLaN_20128, partial [Haematococcus lacustris]
SPADCFQRCAALTPGDAGIAGWGVGTLPTPARAKRRTPTMAALTSLPTPPQSRSASTPAAALRGRGKGLLTGADGALASLARDAPIHIETTTSNDETSLAAFKVWTLHPHIRQCHEMTTARRSGL